MVSAALERKVWTRTKGSNLYPNLYVVLVATPGIGKSVVLSQAFKILHQVQDIQIAPESVTTASLIDAVAAANRHTANGLRFNAIIAVASELGIFLPNYDNGFINTLTKLYDGEHYEERRRTGSLHTVVERPLLSILGGTTPAYLSSAMPDIAWQQGLTARTLFISSTEIVKVPIWSGPATNDALKADLIADLARISETIGMMQWTPECMTAISAWDDEGLPPIPDHIKLQHYNARRLTHVLKLCIVAHAAHADDRLVTLEDFKTAQGWLLEAEAVMATVFDGMSSKATDCDAIEEAKGFLRSTFIRDGRPVGEHMLCGFLQRKVPVQHIQSVIESMVASRAIKRVMGQDGFVHIIPLD
ncbi:MAG TPA: DUF3987 domain-containing protein [Candidatus Acidoferrum sp.]|nr:DUF3987 domain-containing protein [Candidatus Acidoferrum sp.]